MTQTLKSIRSLLTITLSFLFLIFVLNPIQVLSVLIYPVSPNAFRKINRWCARCVWGIWAVLVESQNKVQVRFTGDRPPWQENALVIPNHQSSLDIVALLSFAWRCGRLGDLKWFVKDPVKYVPGIGWGMKFLDCVFVKRDWAKDSQRIDALFRKYKESQIPLFLVSFLEGTRRTPDKLKKAQVYAKEQNLHVPQHSLVPRTKGFVASMEGLHEHLDAVYDVTLGYPQDTVPTLLTCITARLSGYDIHVKRYPITELPKDADGLNAWVMDRFQEKDERMVNYHTQKCFPGPSNTFSIPAADWLVPEKSRNRPEFSDYSDK